MDNDRTDPAERIRLPGPGAEADRQADEQDTWPGAGFPGPGPAGPDRTRAYSGYEPPAAQYRERGLRGSRRVSNWTAAALIAGVAATTGYLAHAIPAGGGATQSGTTATTTPAQSPNSTATTPAAPAAPKPVATSGGSGASGGGDD